MIKSKQKHRFWVIFLLAVVLSLLFQIGIVQASTEPGDGSPGGGVLPLAESDPCEIKLQSGQSIPDTFPVNCLTVTEQKDSKFVPKKGSPDQATITNFLVNVIDLLIKLIGSVALIVFMLGAFLAITSEGKEDRLEMGKTTMLYAIIGLLVSLFSFLIVTVVQSVFY